MGIIKKLKFDNQLEADNALIWVNSQMGFPTNFENKQNTLTWDVVTNKNGFFYFIEPPITHNYTVVDVVITPIDEIFIDYENEIYKATLSNSTIIDVNNSFIDIINSFKPIFEGIYVNPINTIKATFSNISTLTFNDDLTINCNTLEGSLFSNLSNLLKDIKTSLLFQTD